jgi:hypothetical protein
MTLDPRWLAEMNAKHKAASAGEPVNARNCSNCGYDLKGLKASGICPECGTPYRVRIGLRARDELRNMSREQLEGLRNATGLCAAGVFGAIGALLVAWMAGYLTIGPSKIAATIGDDVIKLAFGSMPIWALAWIGGMTWLTIAPRVPVLGDEPEFMHFDNTQSNAGVWIIRATQACWFVFACVVAGEALTSGLGRPMLVMGGVAGLIAGLGLAPVSVLLRRFAALLHDDGSAQSLMLGVFLMPMLGLSAVGMPILSLYFGNYFIMCGWTVLTIYWSCKYLASIWYLWRGAAWAVGNIDYENSKQREFMEKAQELARRERERNQG